MVGPERYNLTSIFYTSFIEEFTELLESGFEYVSDYEDRKVLRKRK